MPVKNRSPHAPRRSPTLPLSHLVTQPLVITIDGPAGSGKSTAAKHLAKKLGLLYLDTGATYRVLAYAAIQKGLHPIADAKRIARMVGKLPFAFRQGPDGQIRVLLDRLDVSRVIRTEEITEAAAYLAQDPRVRKTLVERQRQWARKEGVVAEGRDTGSVVFPQATHKFFLKASLAVRAHRRQRELSKLYKSQTPLAQVSEQLHFRDSLDRTRRVGPLIKPKGAVEMDTSHLTVPQVVEAMLRRIQRGGSFHAALKSHDPG